MLLRYVMDARAGHERQGVVHGIKVHPARTVAIGAIGGVIVGMTSVGAGSLMIILLLFLYPMLGANQLVGTDLTQAVPLTFAAALGALIFGHIEFGVTVSLILGSVPAVLIGSTLSSSAPDRYIRPVITFVIFASGLKYIGLETETLGWVLCATLLIGASAWLVSKKPWQPSQTHLPVDPDRRHAPPRADRVRLAQARALRAGTAASAASAPRAGARSPACLR